jgi:hypothetical protein
MNNIRHPKAGALEPIIFYLDETWFNQYRSPSKTWQYYNDRGCLKVPETKVEE